MKIVGNGGHSKVVREVADHCGISLDDSYAFIAVGNNEDRKAEVERHTGYDFPVLIHPSAVVSPTAHVGPGTVIMAGVIVAADAIIGDHVILNHGCTVDHGCVIEDFAHIAPGAHLCGNVRVGEGALVGVGVGLVPSTMIQPWTTVKAHAIRRD